MKPSEETPGPSSPTARQACVLIVDIVRSTALYEEIGNLRARATVGECLAGLSRVVGEMGGQVIKSMGDGLLCTFDAPPPGVQAAISMRDLAPEHKLSVRVGVHYGEVLEEERDIFGDAVNTTSRIADVAKPSEILITKSVCDALPPITRALLHPVQPVSVKGKREPLELYAILEGAESGTVISFGPLVPAARPASLELVYGSGRCTVGSDLREVTIGREAGNDLVVSSQFASRQHARVYYRGGKFVLADQSANGTFLVPKGERKIVLRREEALLPGAGRIYLGADPDTGQVEPVEFRQVFG